MSEYCTVSNSLTFKVHTVSHVGGPSLMPEHTISYLCMWNQPNAYVTQTLAHSSAASASLWDQFSNLQSRHAIVLITWLPFYVFWNNTTSKNVANSLYFYMFRPLIGHHQVVYITQKIIRRRGLSLAEARHSGHIKIIITKRAIMLK